MGGNCVWRYTSFLVNLNSVSAAVNNQYTVFRINLNACGLIKKPF